MKSTSFSIRQYALTLAIASTLGLIAYALFSLTAKKSHDNQLARFAVGTLRGLDTSQHGKIAPESVFADLGGERVTLHDFPGQVILVNYWATWCGPCEREIPSLAALQTARGGPAFKVVAISIDDPTDRDYAARRLVELSGGVLDFYRLADGAEGWNIVYDSGAGGGFPTTILYDKNALRAAKLEGYADWNSDEALALIDSLTGRSAKKADQSM